jgi:arsenical pump membrane protein
MLAALLSARSASLATWVVAAAATAGVIARPFGLPEAVWAGAGAAVLLAAGLLPWGDALAAVGKGVDVYLFLTGMMLLAEMARGTGLFDHVAARAARLADGNPRRLFALVYGIGIVVTALLSNDATAVVLTPAVFAAARAAKAEPLPYLFICAFVANAASFVLPISNPANLVVFGQGTLPPLGAWLARFALPSVLVIAATYAVLRVTQRASLRAPIARDIAVPALAGPGRLVAGGIGATAAALLAASAFDTDLGWPTCAAAVCTLAAVAVQTRRLPWGTVRQVSWAVLPLVAGLFVLVAGLERTGVIRMLADGLRAAAEQSAARAAWGAGALVAVLCNLVNNLPAGLVTGSAIAAAGVPPQVAGALLIGVDLGPNLSVTGSLATILWLVALRREGLQVGFWQFLRLGALVMPPALALAIGGLLLTG